MGNLASCVSPDMTKLSVKVVLPDGKLEEYRRSVVVAELMMEHPNHFVCHSSSLTNISKKSMLSAEIELEAGRLYYLLPYDKFQGILAPESTDAPGNKPARAVNAIQQLAQAKFEVQSKQTPMMTRVTVKGDDLNYLLSEVGTAARRSPIVSYSSPDLRALYTNQMLTRSSSWKPQLETIQEVVVVSRSKKQRVHNWEDPSAEDSRQSEPESTVASPKASIKKAAVVPVMSTPPPVAAAPGAKKKTRGEKKSLSRKVEEQLAKPQGPANPGVYTELFPMVVQYPPTRVQAVN